MNKRVVRERDDSVESTEGLDEKVEAAKALLPAWFVGRMMTDAWLFGLMLANGKTAAVRQIVAVQADAAGNVWIDAKLIDGGGVADQGLDLLFCAEGRPSISLNARHIVGALELRGV